MHLALSIRRETLELTTLESGALDACQPYSINLCFHDPTLAFSTVTITVFGGSYIRTHELRFI